MSSQALSFLAFADPEADVGILISTAGEHNHGRTLPLERGARHFGAIDVDTDGRFTDLEVLGIRRHLPWIEFTPNAGPNGEPAYSTAHVPAKVRRVTDAAGKLQRIDLLLGPGEWSVFDSPPSFETKDHNARVHLGENGDLHGVSMSNHGTFLERVLTLLDGHVP